MIATSERESANVRHNYIMTVKNIHLAFALPTELEGVFG